MIKKSHLFPLIFLTPFLILISSQCPTLPSGRCYVDCTQTIYQVICEDVNGLTLHSDIEVYTNSSQIFQLTIWNSPAVNRLGPTILSAVKTQITSVYLDNLRNLIFFPELAGLTNMTQLKIMNSPKLMDMPAELLPKSIESIYLYATNITSLINDFDETFKITSLRNFSFIRGSLRFIQPHFFSLFPNLTALRISHTRFFLDTVDQQAIYPVAPLRNLTFTENNFTGMSEERGALLIHKLIEYTPMAPGGVVDLSGNELAVSTEAVLALRHWKGVKSLIMRGNRFMNFTGLTGVFKGFDQLEMLDLSRTGLLKTKGAFSGLPKLRTLLLANNNFRDLTLTDVFSGSKSDDLRILDLSGNRLRALPTAAGTESFSESLEEFHLSNNDLDLDNIQDYENSSATFNDYNKLKYLDISYNKLMSFNSERLNRLKRLEKLNLACNKFLHVTKKYFDQLPATLRFLNLSFCATGENDSPRFTNDAFSGMSEKLETLLMQSGYLTNAIFARFKLATKLKLKNLDLSWNLISGLPKDRETLVPLMSLITLRLKGNFFQSIGPKEFQYFPMLKKLDLSSNKIISIGGSDLDGLYNLEILDLTDNSIIQVEKGAFRSLTKLKSLYFGKNSFTNIGSLFDGVQQPKLQQLSLDGMPVSCIGSDIAGVFRHLKWIYLNRSQPLYLAYGSFRQMKDDISTTPPDPMPFGDVSASEMGCDEDVPYHSIVNSYYRLMVRDGSNKISQQAVLNFPSCHVDAFRNLRQLVENVIC